MGLKVYFKSAQRIRFLTKCFDLVGDPSASGGAPIEKLAHLGCLLLVKHLLCFPKICPETILPLDLVFAT